MVALCALMGQIPMPFADWAQCVPTYHACVGVVLQALEVTEASIDAEMTLLVASEMERIADTMRTQNCCENSTIIPKFILGADQLAAQLRSSTVGRTALHWL